VARLAVAQPAQLRQQTPLQAVNLDRSAEHRTVEYARLSCAALWQVVYPLSYGGDAKYRFDKPGTYWSAAGWGNCESKQAGC